MDNLDITKWGVALIGVSVGFILKEISDFIKEKFKNHKYKVALNDELNANSYQVKQKIDIARQMEVALKNKKFLGGLSVPFAFTVYENFFPAILKELDSLQRDNVRHIYSTLRILDDYMFKMEEAFKQDSMNTVMIDVNEAYIGKIKDILVAYDDVHNLIEKYLAGTPVDIYNRLSVDN